MCMSAVGSMKIFKGGLVPLVHKTVGELREKHEKALKSCCRLQVILWL